MSIPVLLPVLQYYLTDSKPNKMQYLLSLPENLVSAFHTITHYSPENWFVASDPPGNKIGSGGGTAFLLSEHSKKLGGMENYLSQDKKIIIHAGGQSRRLPGYAPSGKILTPIPVFRWSRGQSLDQTLLDLQLPLLERVMSLTSPDQNTLIASGDVMILTGDSDISVPDADVVCLGIWVDPHLAARHGVFFTPKNNPRQLDFMLQKPDHQKIESLATSHLFMMDIGIWILSDKAVNLLMKRSGWEKDKFKNGIPDYYDLYSTFGVALGTKPDVKDEELNALTVGIVPLNKGEFYHYGTSRELISSTEKIQNRIKDQRAIWHNRVKVHPSLFVQNAESSVQWNAGHYNVWIENSHVPSDWKLNHDHIITGVPENDWKLNLPAGMCLDIIPVGTERYCIRPYSIDDAFRGALADPNTTWMGTSFADWLKERTLDFSKADLDGDADIQSSAIFPVLTKKELSEGIIKWMMDNISDNAAQGLWLSSERYSADQISANANLERLQDQRKKYRLLNLSGLAKNYQHSVFYQANLKQIAGEFVAGQLPLPRNLDESVSPMIRFRDHMFRSEVLKQSGKDGSGQEQQAFEVLQKAIVSSIEHNPLPQLNICSDQIIWGRSPIRLDLAGGWSDTPPFCLQSGGSVLNMAVELNGQPPIQVYIRLSSEKKITLRSIDIGIAEKISTYDELRNFNVVGSAFSIPKAALCLAGFHPDFCGTKYVSLEKQLDAFGGGFEISLLAAIPKGSGLGTSSVLAATVLGTLSDFCSLNWDLQSIGHRTLILEQLLTTGGGWQDQYGGIFPGVKLLESEPGTQEVMNVRWLPDHVFTDVNTKGNWLLYYTGVTRVAKNILAEIVRGMFLNEGYRLRLLNDIRQHSYAMAEAIQRNDFKRTGELIARSWQLNMALDSGTNTLEVQQIIDKIKDYTFGFKLLGAGGGGYMLICAKDSEAAAKIQNVLTSEPPNNRARFVSMDVSQLGFQVSRS
ncbi:bifunctional fucokinase/fucose-1-phosphate guanylyltransferase [Saccharicrinis sp. FJH2]|uniref:bifunctional fucokinase/fucose-1-phosphate guanylyltransferase n=1 Tax=Saccharicrinis sp. FJH65 TaxID=3344659 RepID=UPI0035F28C87